MAGEFQVAGKNAAAPFALKVHRGDGMALLAMNWRNGQPPRDFVGFAIEYRVPDGTRFFAVPNRIAFPGPDGAVNPNKLSSRLSPIQKFRWVHFPFNAEIPGDYTYMVTPVFMDEDGQLSYGEPQTADIELRRETYPGALNVAFTRGFVSSQAFVDRWERFGPISTLLPEDADDGLTFTPTHPKTEQALSWMGFEDRHAIYETLDEAIGDASAKVCVVAYDLSEKGFVDRLRQLGPRLKIIIDDEGKHGAAHSGETQSADILIASAGAANVKRQSMGKLQHNKMIVVDGNQVKKAIGGSTNFSWRGFYVQSNNAMIFTGAAPVQVFREAFEDFWTETGFATSRSASWRDLGIAGVDVKATFSPHAAANAQLDKIADDIDATKSSLLFSLAFLWQTPGAIRDAVARVRDNDARFVYGISDKKVGGLDVQKPDGNPPAVFPTALLKGKTPAPFKAEPVGGSGNRMHHKFVVIDFDKPSARVYLGSYNFSKAADVTNGENLILARDRRIAVSYMVEALRTFDHYHFRIALQEAKIAGTKLQLKLPPAAGQDAWWLRDYTDVRRIKDREMFS
ncbi:phospholipase D-like domain-containing protein [Mesorhizobium sp. LjRoot246]|uniref:phospholipase D-like domain-containing protein n=1 Tax=Mesorhizobium sp. LjRoot246 TaxID=3342294 RepID=UPI003ECDF02C